MKKIGILTYHTGYNYGASLQAYALQSTVQKLGGNCEIIHFETMRFLASREMFSRRPTRVKEWIKLATRLPYLAPLKKRQQLFDAFTKECLSLSPLYRTEQEVIDHAEEYDCIICGSDQIWNLSQQDAPAANPLFFLNFPKKQKRVSYAASFGKWVKEAPAHEAVFLPWVKEFDAVSVRETSGVDYLRSRGVECSLTLDPTVLLDKEDYDKICVPRLIPEDYVLLFSWACNNETVKAAKSVAAQMNLPLISLTPPPRTMFSGVKRKLDVGPREFLSMIKYASFVVTESFHGTAFSMTLEKPFASVVVGQADPRMESLMHALGLDDHLVKPDQIDVAALMNTDFEAVRAKKKDFRASSLEFLKNAIGEFCDAAI